jgi:hypothetical protein
VLLPVSAPVSGARSHPNAASSATPLLAQLRCAGDTRAFDRKKGGRKDFSLLPPNPFGQFARLVVTRAVAECLIWFNACHASNYS